MVGEKFQLSTETKEFWDTLTLDDLDTAYELIGLQVVLEDGRISQIVG